MAILYKIEGYVLDYNGDDLNLIDIENHLEETLESSCVLKTERVEFEFDNDHILNDSNIRYEDYENFYNLERYNNTVAALKETK